MPIDGVGPRPDGMLGLLTQITRLQWYLAQRVAEAYRLGAQEEAVGLALQQGLDQATFNDAFWVPAILPEHSNHDHRVQVNGRNLGCCYICGYIGDDPQSYCPNCQPDLIQGEGDFWACTVRDIYQSFPFFMDYTNESLPDTA
jgi:hypothetical protein